MFRMNRFAWVTAFLFIVWSSTVFLARDTRKIDVNKTLTIPAVAIDEADRAHDAAEILTKHYKLETGVIPKGLLRDASAIVVIPNYVKGAFGIGGSYGKGLFAGRDEHGCWLPPSYVRLTGGSFGFQIGVQATDLVLVFKGKKAAERLMKGKLKLGGEASAAAGPIGRGAEIGTVYFRDGIYSYSHSKGVFAGVALNGAVLTVDDHANANAYGVRLFGDEFMKDGAVEVTDVVRPFMEAVNGYATAQNDTNPSTDVASSNTDVGSSNADVASID